MIKILHVITSLHIGGAEKLLLDSIAFYNKKGIKIDLLLLNGNETVFLNNIKSQKICNIYSLGDSSVYKPTLIFKIGKYLKEYDIVHVHLFPTIYWVALAHLLKRSKIPLVYTEHSTHNKRRDRKWMQFVEKFIYGTYSKVICISEKTKGNLSLWLDLKKEDNRLCVIHNGINLANFENATPITKKELNIPEKARVILMTARFNFPKDHNTLIKAFALLENKDTFLVFVGDGFLRNESENLVTQLGLNDRVVFLGIREDIPQLIKMSDICVLSSNWEGFPLVAAEYMAAERPTIVSDVDGLRDVVKGAGILFEKGNSNDLKDKLESLLNNEHEYEKISKLCFQKSKEYSIGKMVDSYIEVYDEVLSRK